MGGCRAQRGHGQPAWTDGDIETGIGSCAWAAIGRGFRAMRKQRTANGMDLTSFIWRKVESSIDLIHGGPALLILISLKTYFKHLSPAMASIISVKNTLGMPLRRGGPTESRATAWVPGTAERCINLVTRKRCLAAQKRIGKYFVNHRRS